MTADARPGNPHRPSRRPHPRAQSLRRCARIFFESFNARDFAAATGVDTPFVQDNHSRSVRGVLRGIHYQIQHPQGKLVRVIHGEVFDVAVDLRRSSPTFGKWTGVLLSAENRRHLWVPPGFGHGFLVTNAAAECCTRRPTTGTPNSSAR